MVIKKMIYNDTVGSYKMLPRVEGKIPLVLKQDIVKLIFSKQLPKSQIGK